LLSVLLKVPRQQHFIIFVLYTQDYINNEVCDEFLVKL
jgi:hypothetical protein